VANVDEALDATVAERQDRVGSSEFELAEECDSRDSWELANERRYTCSTLAGTRNGDEHGPHLLRFQVSDDVVDAFPMKSPVTAFASRIDPESLFRSEQGGDWRKFSVRLSSIRHDPPPAGEKESRARRGSSARQTGTAAV